MIFSENNEHFSKCKFNSKNRFDYSLPLYTRETVPVVESFAAVAPKPYEGHRSAFLDDPEGKGREGDIEPVVIKFKFDQKRIHYLLLLICMALFVCFNWTMDLYYENNTFS